jgi:hypothetical protein
VLLVNTQVGREKMFNSHMNWSLTENRLIFWHSCSTTLLPNLYHELCTHSITLSLTSCVVYFGLCCCKANDRAPCHLSGC